MIFRGFRLVVGLIAAALALWMIVGGVTDMVSGGEGRDAGLLVGAVLRIVVGILILGLYYYTLWSNSPIQRNLENIF